MLHEMHTEDSSLPKSIETTSKNWGHMFWNQIQSIYRIDLAVGEANIFLKHFQLIVQ